MRLARVSVNRGQREPVPVSVTLGSVVLDFISGSTAPWSLTQGQGTSLLMCLKGEAFYTSSSASLMLNPRAYALILPAHSGTLLVGTSGLVAKMTVLGVVGVPHLQQGARFEHLRHLLNHLAGLYVDEKDMAVPLPLAEAYGKLLIEALRADAAHAVSHPELGSDEHASRFAYAKAYIRAHLFQRIRLRDVAQALNVSPRTVQLLFAQEAGESLTRYVARMRLEEAHQRLLEADPQTNVTQIALDCGFNHAGLFSAAYRHAFGELPRDTLARARRGAEDEPRSARFMAAS